MSKVLFTGGRDKFACWSKLDNLRAMYNITVVVHGACPSGVDYDVDQWAKARGLEIRDYPAPFDLYGNIAGRMRNAQMLREEPDIDIVIAFPGGPGTADMVERAKDAGYDPIYV